MGDSSTKLHERAVAMAREFRRCEALLIGILMEVERQKVFLSLGHSSMHRYCVDALGLTDQQAYCFVGIARKSREVPELKAAIDSGKMNASNARKVATVLTAENKEFWLPLAEKLPQRELEREIRKVTEGDDSFDLRIRITPAMEKKLKRVKDLLSQKKKVDCSTEAAFEALLDEFIARHDPVERAKRNHKEVDIRTVAMKHGVRVQIPAPLVHQTNLRDQRRCIFTKPNGERCGEFRWTEIHHKVPVSEGGKHELSNLETLCAGHHRVVHCNRGATPRLIGGLAAEESSGAAIIMGAAM